jgi:hypothetical protein
VARELKISMETGRVEVPGLPSDDADADTKNDLCVQLIADTEKDVEALEELVATDARGALKRAWVLKTVIDEHPNRWLKDFGQRRVRNGLMTRLEKIKERAFDELPDEIGKQIWEDLPYTRDLLGLLFDKLKAIGEVKRLILTPLGNLKFAQIKYQRDSPEDLARVCRDISDQIRAGSDIDEDVKRWGGANRDALVRGTPPASIPEDMVASATPGLALLGLGLAGIGLGGAILAGQIPALPQVAAFGAIGVGAVFDLVGMLLFTKARKQKAAAPVAFAKLSEKYRERLYLVCALRNLYAASSRFTVTNSAFEDSLRKTGGKARWKRVKFEGRDLTELFATEEWHERGTVEHWLSEKVTKVFRLESTTLASPEDLDDETWGVILKAYLLEGVENPDGGSESRLASVGHLLFNKRGEDVTAERARIFGEVNEAWATAEREGVRL